MKFDAKLPSTVLKNMTVEYLSYSISRASSRGEGAPAVFHFKMSLVDAGSTM